MILCAFLIMIFLKHNVQWTNLKDCLSKKLLLSFFIQSHSILTFCSIANHKECMDALWRIGCQGNLIVIWDVWFALHKGQPLVWLNNTWCRIICSGQFSTLRLSSGDILHQIYTETHAVTGTCYGLKFGVFVATGNILYCLRDLRQTSLQQHYPFCFHIIFHVWSFVWQSVCCWPAVQMVTEWNVFLSRLLCHSTHSELLKLCVSVCGTVGFSQVFLMFSHTGHVGAT